MRVNFIDVKRLVEAGEADHVVESMTRLLSRPMLEQYSHIRRGVSSVCSATLCFSRRF